MDNFDLKKYISENRIMEEEDDSVELTQVGGDTGVKLPMKKIFKMLKREGYSPIVTKGNRITGINRIEVEISNNRYTTRWSHCGTLIIDKNGQLFGDDLWGMDINSEDEIFPAIEEYYRDQVLNK